MVLANFFIAQGLVIKGHFIDRTNKLSLETHFHTTKSERNRLPQNLS